MSSHTYVCGPCGELRRRPAAYRNRDGTLPRHHPRCCDAPMIGLTKGRAEAATHLTPAQRVEWLARGGLIVLKPGRKWRAALTDREIARAKEQVESWRAPDSPPR